MTLNKEKLKILIEQIVEDQLSLDFDKEDENPKVAYERFLELKDKHSTDFWILDKIGPEAFKEILDLRDEAEDYSDFFKKVGPGEYDRGRGMYKRTNKFGMRPEMVRGFYDKKYGSESADKLQKLKKEYDKLKDRFKTVGATDQTDMMYGRKRTNVIDTVTGQVMSSTTDRKGSLGS